MKSCQFRGDILQDRTTCAFYAGLVPLHNIPISACDYCQKLGPPPNAYTDDRNKVICAARVCEPHVKDGEGELYGVSVDDAAVTIAGTPPLQNAIIKSVEYGHQAPKEAGRLLRSYGCQEGSLKELTDAVDESRLSPKQAAEIAVAARL